MTAFYGGQVSGKRRPRPAASILLPVRNGAAWLSESLASILNQRISDIEVLVLDHGSTDESADIAMGFPLPGLRVVPCDGPTLASALTRGVEEAGSEILLRLDADDVMSPDRIASQLRSMHARPRLVATGSWASIRSDAHSRPWVERVPTWDAQIRVALYVGNPFIHSTMALRRSAVLSAGGYQAPHGDAYPEDLDLWVRISEFGELGNIPLPLVSRRIIAEGVMQSHGAEINAAAGAILTAYWSRSPDPRVAASAQVASSFVARKRRLSLAEGYGVLRSLTAVRRQHGWRASHGAWTFKTWAKPFLWVLSGPRSIASGNP